MLSYFPKYFTTKSINIYIGALILCNIIFFSHSLPIIWWLFGITEVIGFFYYANKLTKEWINLSQINFQKKLFISALFIRIIWVILSYFFYTIVNGNPFEYSSADAISYHAEADWLTGMIIKGNLEPYFSYINGRYSDLGYTFYLGWQYWITGSSIIIARLIKALLGAYMCVLVYKLAKRNFGESVGRMSAIFCMLMPNLIYYAGLHTKEVEMVFISVAFVERMDFLFRSRNYSPINIILPILFAGSLFFFRTVLGVTTIFAFFSTVVFLPAKLLGIGKRSLLLVWVLVTISYFVGGRIAAEVENTWATKTSNQEASLSFRSTRVNGNTLAKYASSVVFVPLIFVIPFPTIINTPNQENLQLINGGNYVKNILAFFVIYALFWVIINKKWREFVLIGSFSIGYLLIIANSSFAQSERFHQPALPFLLIIASFGINKITNNEKKYFDLYLGVIFIAILGWSWYKLAGRGLA